MREGWKRCQLGDVIELKRGYDLPQKERQPGCVPLVSSSGVSDKHAVAKVKGPGVITGRYGTIGTVYYVEDDFWPLNTTLYVRDFKGNDPRFVSYFLRGIDFHAYSDKAAVPGLNRNHLHEAQILFPPLPEQRAIAATLGALDDKIELNRRMNATLEAMARALFRDWFVTFGPTRAKMALSASGAKNANDSRAPTLSPDLWSLFPDRLDAEGKPEGWEFETVIEQADWINGAAYKNMHFSDAPDALPVIKIAELKNGVTGNTAWTATDLGSRYQIEDGELLFSWSGNPDTSIDTFLWSGGMAWLNQHIFAVRENGKRSKPFLHAMLKYLKPEFAELARNKQTTGLGHVTKADMKRMLICTGSQLVHDAFDQLITPIFDRAFLLQMESRTLAQTRDLLLPRLMSGELRVAEAGRLASEGT